MTQQFLDQHAQPVVLFRQLAYLRVALHGRRDDIANHALQRVGVFGQGGQVDLHSGMMNNAAASLKAFFGVSKIY
jgi:hypothetical protein